MRPETGEQQQVIAGGLKRGIVGALLPLAVNRNPGRAHVQHYPMWKVDSFHLRDQLAIDRSQTGKILLLSQYFGPERLPS